MTKFLDLVAATGPELSIRATVLYVAACGLALASATAKSSRVLACATPTTCPSSASTCA